MTLYSTLLIINEAYKSLVLVPNSAPHTYLIGKKYKKIQPTDPKIKKLSDLRATQQLLFLFLFFFLGGGRGGLS